MTAPGVAGAPVVAVDRASGARPVAFVLTEPGHAIDEQTVIDHCRERLARYKVPVRVIPLDTFPITDGPNGVKIRLTELRDMARDAIGD